MIRKVATWNERASEILHDALGPDEKEIAADVDAGIAELFFVGDDTAFVTRIEGEALIVCCYQGRDLRTVAKSIYLAAQRAKLSLIQFHTRRLGMIRLLQEFSPELIGQYFIFSVGVKDGKPITQHDATTAE